MLMNFLCVTDSRNGGVYMDIQAPIVPGESAAGIRLGSPIEEILQEQKTSFLSEEVVHPLFPLPITTRYRSEMVDVWVKEGKVEQIMVHDGYRGKLMGTIGLGSTLADIERHIGAWEEDEEDNLVIRNLPGVMFELEGSFPDWSNPGFRLAPIKEICLQGCTDDTGEEGTINDALLIEGTRHVRTFLEL